MDANLEAAEKAAQDLNAFAYGAVDFVVDRFTEAQVQRRGLSPGPALDTTAMRGSLEITIGQPSRRLFDPAGSVGRIAGRAEVEQILSRVDFSQPIWWTFLADYASILERGRRPGRDGVIRGSLQTPDGWVHLAIAQTEIEFSAATAAELIARGRRWAKRAA